MEVLERILIFVVCFTLWVCGILLIVFGSIALADPETIINLLSLIDGVSNVTKIFDVMPLFEGVAIFMIVLGCFLFLTGASGLGILCHGKIRFGYILAMTCALLTEVALIIYAAVYPGTMRDWVNEQMTSSLSSFNSVIIADDGAITYRSEDIASGWEHLQFETQCCGAVSMNDFASYNWDRSYTVHNTTYRVTFPPSCCTVQSQYIGDSPYNVDQLANYNECFKSTSATTYLSTKPCSDVVMSMVWEFNYISIIICSCLIVVELIGIITAGFYAKRGEYV